ncbi:MAG: VWA domain-containing protein [Flavobacteriaceae bacterium]|nr:VWA domain-containing protein [Flavobacteriaceae bacterium]
MTAQTILFIIIAAVVALTIVIFMYGYKTKYTGKFRWLFGSLRFISLLALFILLINPKLRTEEILTEKPKLILLADNSNSIASLEEEETLKNIVAQLSNNEDLQDKFELRDFKFGDAFAPLDSIDFSARQTNIAQAFSATNELFKDEVAPTILISDGNQTYGNDYEFSSRSFSNKIYPLVIGDSTQYVDLKIEQLNTNRYSFLKNEFPVEVILVYSGKDNINSRFSIQQGGSTLYSQNVSFSEGDNTQTLSFTIPSTKVGLQRYLAYLAPLEEEKNKSNNAKNFAVEVIDEATNILVVSDILHPDMGAIKKSIETNEQRRVSFMKPSEAAKVVNDYQLLILNQPDRSFSSVYTEIEKLKKNTLTLTGLQTDWRFLNTVQNNFEKLASNQSEDVSGKINLNYTAFSLEPVGFDEYSPLATDFGELTLSVPHDIILNQFVDGFSTGSPMLATWELNGKRDAIWDGEGIWKWRAQSFLETDSFETFDEFLGKLIQYLASNKRRSRLDVSFETFYYNNNPVVVSAQYFDKNFVFDNRAQLVIRVQNKETEELSEFPLLLKNNFYLVDLNSLPAGDYSFTVSVEGEAVARSGNFTILEFNVEQQFLNANVTKLSRVATHSGGELFFADQIEELISSLTENESFKPIQKTNQKVVPLIDWKYLLGLIVLTLSLEWFIRKYNGLI